MTEGKNDSPRKFSRRQVIKYLTLGALGGAASGFTGVKIGNLIVDQENLVGIKKLQEELYATATAVVSKNEHSSFVPEGNFTPELYDKIEKSTFALNVHGDGRFTNMATSWCAEKKGNSVYLVTNNHAFEFPDKSKVNAIDFWRPHIDNSSNVPVRVAIAKSEKYDIAVLKCEVSPEYAQLITPLPYRDNFRITKGTRFLVVGFPFEFRDVESSSPDILTSASYVDVDMDMDDKNHTFRASGIVDAGGSGSSAVVPDESGNPLVEGIIYGANTHKAFGLSLCVNELIQAIDIAPETF